MSNTKKDPNPEEEILDIAINTIQAQDIDSIGTQLWMSKNLDVLTFRNGDTIPHAKSMKEWKKARRKGEAAWCYYGNDSTNGEKYGKLYN